MVMRFRRFTILVATTAMVAASLGWGIGGYAQWAPGTSPGEFPVTFSDLILNTSGVAQTKEGPLTVNGGFKVNGNLCVGYGLNCTPVGVPSSQICWNGECRGSWQQAGGADFVHLNPDIDNPPGADYGFAGLTGPAATQDTLEVFSGSDDDFLEQYGILATASPSTAEFSAGLVGEARANDSRHIAVLGRTGGSQSAWAGYFAGNVMIDRQFRASGSRFSGDLVVGDDTGVNVIAARANSLSQVCLNDNCRSNWNIPGVSSWRLSSTTLYPTDSTSSLAIGGTNPSAPFFLAYLDGTFLNGKQQFDLAVSRNTTLGSFVVGEAPSSLPIVTTCGDGVCNGQENNTFGNPNYCPTDCDKVPPGNITFDDFFINPVARTVWFFWTYPSDIDVAGVRIVMTTGVEPSGPYDGVIADVLRPTSDYQTDPMARGVQYYFGFYAYDRGGNFAAGATVPVFFP